MNPVSVLQCLKLFEIVVFPNRDGIRYIVQDPATRTIFLQGGRNAEELSDEGIKAAFPDLPARERALLLQRCLKVAKTWELEIIPISLPADLPPLKSGSSNPVSQSDALQVVLEAMQSHGTSETESVCHSCGQELTGQNTSCPNCGREIAAR